MGLHAGPLLRRVQQGAGAEAQVRAVAGDDAQGAEERGGGGRHDPGQRQGRGGADRLDGQAGRGHGRGRGVGRAQGE